jgi:hypothetical protein
VTVGPPEREERPRPRTGEDEPDPPGATAPDAPDAPDAPPATTAAPGGGTAAPPP